MHRQQILRGKREGMRSSHRRVLLWRDWSHAVSVRYWNAASSWADNDAAALYAARDNHMAWLNQSKKSYPNCRIVRSGLRQSPQIISWVLLRLC